ncbi:GntR family transcriptional regulator [Lactonifactor longoviformis]|uniref:GntR family transcriptional regulator n=1 Tax=Lactonifactor longoviformis TaxID=341220 RepID=UPI00210EE1D5|nr:GntR family transcriptional regulator [Lactonifactor longoviformis]MCQ4673175.1 GntR family transcriptional regulator [Lactonifactor longoviformis]
MEPQETKFSFIYHEIKQLIINGQIPPGNRLPSSRMLCNQYHASRYTINRVLEVLKDEGFIDIKPRLAPIALSGKSASRAGDMEFDILRKRESIVQLYKTFGLLLPPLLVFASQNLNLEIMPHYKQALKASRLGLSRGGWRPSSKFIKEILEIGGNPLLANLFSTFELHNNLSFFTEECPYFLETFLGPSLFNADVLVDILKGNDPAVKHRQLAHLFQTLSDSIAATLEHLAGITSPCPAPSSASFLWRPTRGKDYFYTRIVSDLNQKIGNGEYPCGTYLPYEKQLAHQYGVSVSTIRKALGELAQRGFVKTLNAKGTIVIEPDDSRVNQVLSNPRRTEEALQYLYALQLLALMIDSAALMAAPKFTSKELDELCDTFARQDTICIIDIFEAILKHIEWKPLQTILTEAFRLTEWGHYIAYYDTKKQVLQNLNEQIIEAVQHLREGDARAFASGIRDCYRYTLEHAKKYMIKKYNFLRVSSIRIPEIY